MSKSQYGYVDVAAGRKHDAVLVETQVNLLQRVKESSNPTAAKGYAEAYALISGVLAAKPVDIKQA